MLVLDHGTGFETYGNLTRINMGKVLPGFIPTNFVLLQSAASNKPGHPARYRSGLGRENSGPTVEAGRARADGSPVGPFPSPFPLPGGSVVNDTSLFSCAFGNAHGMAPRTRIATYKVCWTGGCFSFDILRAMDKAIVDGVIVAGKIVLCDRGVTARVQKGVVDEAGPGRAYVLVARPGTRPGKIIGPGWPARYPPLASKLKGISLLSLTTQLRTPKAGEWGCLREHPRTNRIQKTSETAKTENWRYERLKRSGAFGGSP
ncbi:Subtilisin-like protease SBT1-7 [Nymphaea thermarum]|nr:Subtilisin-like protease SBT1-7 [Nymphaea thermarum]